MSKALPETLRLGFEGMMEGMFLGPGWEEKAPKRQQLEMEDAFMGGAQQAFLMLMHGKPVNEIDNELREFGQNIMKRYTDAGFSTGEEEYNAHKEAQRSTETDG